MASKAPKTSIPEVGVGGEQDKLKWEGLNTSVKDARFLRLGQSPDQNNWITGRDGDNIQLRRGSALLGATRRTGASVTGLGIGQIGNTQIPFFSANRSIYYYNANLATPDTVEINTANLLPLGANGEDVSFASYQNLAGSFMYLTSPNSSIYKIPLANPGDALDLQSKSYRFSYIRIDQNRMRGMGRHGNQFAPDLFSDYISNSDKATYTAYGSAQINQLAQIGDGATKAFTGNVGSAGSKSSVFNVILAGAISGGTGISGMTATGGQITITSAAHGRSVGDFVMVNGVTSSGSPVNQVVGTVTGVTDVNTVVVTPSIAAVASLTYSSGGTLYLLEVFTDDQQGNLTSNLGGTGTVNYATGAYAATFNTAPTNGVNLVVNEFTEDATSGGIADFSFAASNPSLGQGYQFPQGGGGKALASAGYQGVEYAFHQNKTWLVGLPTNATSAYGDATNNEYWSHIGIPYPRAQFPTGDGILYLDNTNPAQPQFSILEIPPGSTNLTVVPTWESQDLDLSLYTHDKAVVFRWGEYDILCCKQSINGTPQGFNSQFFIRNLTSNFWNKLDYSASVLGEYLGALLAGDSLSPNLFTLFSGVDDDGSAIPNFWKSGSTDFGFSGKKKCSHLLIEGLIQPAQDIVVSLSLDGGKYVMYFTIQGTGSYVNSSSPVGVGSNTVGSNVIGGGGTITANPFEISIPIFTDYFDYISVQFQAINVGWAQINRMAFRDIRLKARRSLSSIEGVQK